MLSAPTGSFAELLQTLTELFVREIGYRDLVTATLGFFQLGLLGVGDGNSGDGLPTFGHRVTMVRGVRDIDSWNQKH